MSHVDYMSARQLLMEETVGRRARLAKQSEDKQMAAALQRLRDRGEP
jgi:hypothetical protein